MELLLQRTGIKKHFLLETSSVICSGKRLPCCWLIVEIDIPFV
jgi:hypothetical protein